MTEKDSSQDSFALFGENVLTLRTSPDLSSCQDPSLRRDLLDCGFVPYAVPTKGIGFNDRGFVETVFSVPPASSSFEPLAFCSDSRMSASFEPLDPNKKRIQPSKGKAFGCGE